jgi:hypothetical protein
MLGIVISVKERAALEHTRNYLTHDYRPTSIQRELTLDDE